MSAIPTSSSLPPSSSSITSPITSTQGRIIEKRIENILKTENDIPIFPQILSSSSTTESSSSKRKFSIFGSKSKPVPSSSSTPVSLRNPATIQEKTVEKINTIFGIISSLNELKDTQGIFAGIPNIEADQIKLKIDATINEKTTQKDQLEKEFIQYTQAKVDGIVRLVEVIPKEKLKSLKLIELKTCAVSYKDPSLTSDPSAKYRAHRDIIETYDTLMKDENKFTGLALYLIGENQKNQKKKESPFFQKPIPKGTGLVIQLGVKSVNMKNDHPIFVLKPTDHSVGAKLFEPKQKKSEVEDFQKSITDDILQGLKKAEKYTVTEPRHLKDGSSPSEVSFNIVNLVSNLENKTLSDFKTAFPTTHQIFQNLTQEGIENVYGQVGSYLNYRINGSGGIGINLSQIDPKRVIETIPEDKLNRILGNLQKIDEETTLLKMEQLSAVVTEIHGGPELVAANHVIRANLTELGGESPICTILKKTPWGEGILMEYCHHENTLEDLATNKDEMSKLLENSTDDVKKTVCNQYVLDVLFGETDMNPGNCLITSKTSEGQISGISIIDMSLCMPKQGTYGEHGAVADRTESFYTGFKEPLSFFKPGAPFIPEQIRQIDIMMPMMFHTIREKYNQAGTPLTPLQFNAMIARWEFLKLGTEAGLTPTEIQAMVAGSDPNKGSFFDILEKLPNTDFLANEANMNALREILRKKLNEFAVPSPASSSNQ